MLAPNHYNWLKSPKFKPAFTVVATFCPSVGQIPPAKAEWGGAMMMERSKPRIDAKAGLASPLGVAISEGERATLAGVRPARES